MRQLTPVDREGAWFVFDVSRLQLQTLSAADPRTRRDLAVALLGAGAKQDARPIVDSLPHDVRARRLRERGPRLFNGQSHFQAAPVRVFQFGAQPVQPQPPRFQILGMQLQHVLLPPEFRLLNLALLLPTRPVVFYPLVIAFHRVF